MKRVISIFLTSVMCLSLFVSLATTASAGLFDGVETGQMQDTSSDDNGTIYWELDGTALTISGDGYMPNTSGDSWERALGGRKLTSLIIQEGVKSIKEGAFYGEDKLTTVTLPDSLEFIGDSAFAETGISYVTLPKNLQTFNNTIFNSQVITQFNVSPENPNFKSVDGVVYTKNMDELVAFPIGRLAKGGSNNFNIPETVTKIGDYAFLNCKHQSFTVPGHVKTIGMQAFAGNTDLTTIEFMNGVEGIYDGAFLACNKITEFHLPTSVNYLGYCSLAFGYAFDFDGLAFMLDQQGIAHDEINESNAVYYADLTGFDLDCFIICVVNEKTKIYAPTNSAGHKYCNMFDVAFCASEAITPKPLSATKTTNGIEIQWTLSSDATGYNIYRKNESGKYEKIGTVKGKNTLSYTDKNPISFFENTYTVKAYNSKGESSYHSEGVTSYYVAKPKLVAATNHYSGVKVSWEKVSGATNYDIYRMVNESGDWENIATVDKTKLYYIDKNVVNSENYKYTVRAYDERDSSGYNEVGVGTKFVSAPKITDFRNTTDGVQLSWEKVSGASYVICRKTENNGWENIAELGSNTFTYTDNSFEYGVKYTYGVKAVNSGVLSDCYTKTTSVLAPPVLSSASSHYDGVKISWKAVSGATNYNIYRRAKNGPAWLKIGTVSKSRLYFVDGAVSNLEDYQYTVSAYNEHGESRRDETGIGTTYVAAPKVTSFKNVTSGVYLKWNRVAGATSYRIYRKTGNGSWKLIKKLNKDTLKFTDSSAKSGVKYSYAVKAVVSGDISGYYTKTIEYLKKPVVKNAQSTKSGIKVNYSKTTGADKYYVYRRLKGEDDWTRIAIVKGASKVSYTDKTAKKGKTYYYTVRAYSGSYKSAYDNKTGYKIKDKY